MTEAAVSLVVALQQEARPLLRVGSWRRQPVRASQAFFRGRFQGQEGSLVVTGVGRARVEASLAEYLSYERPQVMLSLGFCGALAPTLRSGDLVIPDKLYLLEDGDDGEAPPWLGQALEPDGRLVALAADALGEEGLRFSQGAFLTTSRPVTRPGEKAQLHGLTGAQVVEMESFWVGRFALERGIPFMAARVVLDEAHQALPPYLQRLGGGREGSVWPQAALQLWWLPTLLCLARCMSRGEQALRAFVLPFLGLLARGRALAG